MPCVCWDKTWSWISTISLYGQVKSFQQKHEALIFAAFVVLLVIKRRVVLTAVVAILLVAHSQMEQKSYFVFDKHLEMVTKPRSP